MENNFNYDECLRRSWKYMLKKYIPVDVNRKNIYFYNVSQHFGVFAMCIKTSELDSKNQSYCVTFAFRHPKEEYKSFINKKFYFRSFVIANNYQNKYTYSVNATSPINAVCLAYNKNSENFPKPKKNLKIKPLVISDVNSTSKNYIQVTNLKNDRGYVKNGEELKYDRECSQYCKNFLNEHSEFRNNIRYYKMSCNHGFNTIYGSAMVIRHKDKFTVTFSFLNPSDSVRFSKLSCKRSLMENYNAGKFTYDSYDTTNSLNSLVKQFNKNCYKCFPSHWSEDKIHIDFNYESDIGGTIC